MTVTNKYTISWRQSQMEIFLLLMIKHAIVDLGFQPFGLGATKLKYFGWLAHKQHYIPHGLLTIIALALTLQGPLELVVALGILDYILHWHTDYFKTHIREKMQWKSNQRAFWVLNMFDQMLHFFGYYIIVRLAIG